MVDETLLVHVFMGWLDIHGLGRNDVAHWRTVRELVRKPEADWDVISCTHICYRKKSVNLQQCLLCPVRVPVDLGDSFINASMFHQFGTLLLNLVLIHVVQVPY